MSSINLKELYGTWDKVTEQELRMLVWTMPICELAELFGITAVDISRRCKTSGIKTPPAGFWKKVKEGLIPHPDGKEQQ